MCAKQVKNRKNRNKVRKNRGQRSLRQSAEVRELRGRMEKRGGRKQKQAHKAGNNQSLIVMKDEKQQNGAEIDRKPAVILESVGKDALTEGTDVLALTDETTGNVDRNSAAENADSEQIEDITESVGGEQAGDVAPEITEDGEAEGEIAEVSAETGVVVATDVEMGDFEATTEAKQPKVRHHKLFPLLWWVLGMMAVALVGVAVAGVLGVFGGESEPPMIAVDEPAETPTDSEEPTEEQPAEEKPAEEEKPEEKPVSEPEEQPKPAETPVTPIAPRPGNTATPEVNPGSKVIALTFDDGPSAATTPRLLDILQGRNVKATFFVLGTMAQRSPDLLRREANEGHEVASHTPYHNQLTTLTPAQVRAEALEMDRIFKDILGTVPPFTRPPYGSFNAAVGEALGQPMILWSIDPRDWQDRNASTVCSRVVSAARDGAIILVHDIHATTVDAVPCIIDTLKTQGYEFLTVSELAAARDVPLVNGSAYYSF